MIPIRRALISCWDKTGVADLARILVEHDVAIISSGGTARHLQESGIAVTTVEDLTGYPEVLGGRVKTLHPLVHAGILAADSDAHRADLEKIKARPIDLVVVNLYPFVEEAVTRSLPLEEAIEFIDIGGPTLLRAAAKNFHHRVALHHPDQYNAFLEHFRAHDGVIPLDFARDCARRVFFYTSWYDGQIQDYLGTDPSQAERAAETRTLHLEKIQDLRYGENPHQQAAVYRPANRMPRGLAAMEQLWGKPLSFNNYMDVQGAYALAMEFDGPAAAIIKHTNPCGLCMADSGLADAFDGALRGDPVSAFGGIVACNRPVDGATAERMSAVFFECIIAPGFDSAARDILQKKKNLRLLVLDPEAFPREGEDWKSLAGAFLVQESDPLHRDAAAEWRVVTKATPDPAQHAALAFAWIAARHVKSNAIVLCGGTELYGAGAGQMSRVDSVNIAVMKARQADRDLRGSVLASDAFFPFRDGVDAAAGEGVRAIIQPGGSVRDEEVIAAANEHGIAMIFTGRRHFKH